MLVIWILHNLVALLMCSYILYLYKQTIRFIVQRESRSKSGSGEWPARAVVGAPRVTIEVVGSRFPSSPLTSALPELWYRPHPWRICHWSKGAVVWRVGAMKLVVWSMVVLFLGGGGSYSSFAAGSCLRGVEASSAPPSSVLYPGCEGSFNLASPAFWWASSFDRLWIMWVVRVGFLAFGLCVSSGCRLSFNRMRSRLDRCNSPEQR